MDHERLVAVLRRSGPVAVRRALLLLHALRRVRWSSEGGAAAGDQGRLELEDIVDILLLCCSAPRFIFACGSGGTLVRSADRGHSWRRLQPLPPQQPPAQPPQRKGEDMRAATDAEGGELQAILALLPPGAVLAEQHSGEGDTGSSGSEGEGEGECDGGSSGSDSSSSAPSLSPASPAAQRKPAVSGNSRGHAGAAPSTGKRALAALGARGRPAVRVRLAREAQPDFLDCATWGDRLIAACGVGGTLVVSSDRGVRFASLPPCAALATKRGPASHATIRGVVFTGSDALLFHTTTALLRVPLLGTTSGAAASPAFGDVELLHRFGTAIGCLAFDATLGPSGCVVVASHGALHLSLDGGDRFVTFLHRLGLLRAVVRLPPSFANSGAHTAAQEEPQSRGYSHGSTTKFAPRSATTTAATTAARRSQPLTNSAVAAWLTTLLLERRLAFAALCTRGPLVPYDFSAQLELSADAEEVAALREGRAEELALECAVRAVDHVPFQCTAASQRAGVALMPRPLAPRAAATPVLLRSTAAGASRSVDGGASWSPPSLAHAGNVALLEPGAAVVCNRRKSVGVTEDFGASWSLRVLPASTSAVTLSAVAVMW